MGFLSNVLGAAVKVALTPVAVVKDAANVAQGQDAETTANLLESAGDDLEEATDDLFDGDLI